MPNARFIGSISVFLAVCTGVVAAGLVGSSEAAARTFYVDSGAGGDRNPGTLERPWRSVDRVNRAQLRPGDEVLFRARRRFEGTLSPDESGAAGRPITFSSYGRGRATLVDGVFLTSVSSITIDRLRFTGASQAVAGSKGGTGARRIVLRRSIISDVQIGVNAPNRRDRGWRILRNSISRTGDSAIIVEGRGFTIKGNVIARAGEDSSIPYPKHGIYSKGPFTNIVGNAIRGFETEGVSTRYRKARIVANRISGGETGIAYYRDDTSGAGTTLICGNDIADVESGIYISPAGSAGSTIERFDIRRNTVRPRGQALSDLAVIRAVGEVLSGRARSPSCR